MRIKPNIVTGTKYLFDIVYLGKVIGHVTSFSGYWQFVNEQKLLSRGIV